MCCSRASAGLALILSLALLACEAATNPGDEPAAGEGGSGGDGAGGSGGAGGRAGSGGAGGAGASAGSGGAAGAGGGAGGTAGADAGVAADAAAPDAGGSDAGASGEGGRPASGEPVPSMACSGGAMVPGPSGTQTIMSTGRSRQFIIRMPTGYDGKKPLPVMFAFHGAGGGATSFEGGAFGRISQMAADKAVRIFPQALGNTWSRDEPDDVMFMDNLMAWLNMRVCYDTSRVYATGHSSGAYFSHRLACDRGNVIRAVATSSGGQRRERALDCKTPISGAWLSTGLGDNPGHVMGTRQARDVWLKLGGCQASGATPTTPSPCVSYPGCRPGFVVHYCEHSGGHALPGYGVNGIYNFLFGPSKFF
jgi:poly(3-hydroxybutyrate) depolymerase